MHILLAEDECVTRESARLFLERQGFHVVAVEDGLRALELATSQAFDVVLMDIKMPGLSGLEVARRLRGSGGDRARTPIIAVTAFNRSELPELESCGFTAHIEKPFEHDELVRLVRSAAA